MPRRAQDELATALEDVAVLRDDLGASQLLAARALGNREETKALRAEVVRLQAALEAMRDTRTFRYVQPSGGRTAWVAAWPPDRTVHRVHPGAAPPDPIAVRRRRRTAGQSMLRYRSACPEHGASVRPGELI